MSADASLKCPRCVKRNAATIEKLQQEANDAIGKVPLPEWKALDAEAAMARLTETPEEFRVDHQLSVTSEGLISYRMGGRCSRCDLNVRLEADKQILGMTA